MKKDNILHVPNDLLRRTAKPVKLLTKGKGRRILRLFDLMYAEGGMGLAAPQVGWNVRLFIVGLPIQDKKYEFVFINPKILEYSDETCVMEEGCLSIPGVNAEVERPEKVTIEALDIDGSSFTMETSGILARCIQHEHDHLEGVLFTDKVVGGRSESD